MQIAIFTFLVSFTSITGWLLFREPAQIVTTSSVEKKEAGRNVDGDAEVTASTRPTKKGLTKDRSLSDQELAEMDIERSIFNRLNNIIIPFVDFENTTIEEALDFLRLRFREIESDSTEARQGMSFVIRKPSTASGSDNDDDTLDAELPTIPDWNRTPILLRGRNLTMLQILDESCRQSNLRWEITARGIIIEPIKTTE